MTTSVQNGRVQSSFAGWDVDGDGRIDRADWEADARRVLQAFGETPASPSGRALSDAYLDLWDFLAEKAGIDAHTGALTPEQFKTVVDDRIIGSDGAGFAKALTPAIKALIKLADRDGDGQINPREFMTWLKAVGVRTSDMGTPFAQIDTSGNGQLSTEELVQAVRAYYLDEVDVPLLGH
ncbi:EF-hand domain-containing protein [Streptomyces sp. NBC_00690]|uniref:EF-hand domain-containing protein n=1 Tax=Streptomyces sp. NBC_00690 TaxID=2975808 RepID=UPI002E27EF70|nr:EF-hand domain-containing protein [Streptomyces sp. NBC_00690]